MIQSGPQRLIAALVAVVILGAHQLASQGWGPAQVGITPAAETELQAVVQLAGTVEAETQARIASEEAGVVAELRAREGSFVKQGATLARLKRETLERDLEAARAQLAEAQARLDIAQRSRERSRELHQSGVVSRQQFDDAESEAGAWQGRVDQAKALIGRLEIQIRRSVIRAPFSGVVVAELCEVGEWVAAGGEVLEMFAPDSLRVVVSVPERFFAGAALGEAARIRLESMPERDFDGEIVSIIPKADPQARTFPVKVSILEPGPTIGLGMTATVAFPTGSVRRATIVPKDAVISQGSQRLVYRVDAGPPDEEGNPTEIATPVPVELGAGVKEWIEVRGIRPDDRVVTRGNERLAPGTPLLTEPVEYEVP